MNTGGKDGADFWIERLGLAPHTEGGWYREIWRAGLEIPQNALPAGYGGPRPACTSIYFLLREGEISAWHRVRSAEIWLWHAGGILELRLGGRGASPNIEETRLLGPGIAESAGFQAVVAPEIWQSAVIHSGGFALASCVVSPGFHWQDFSLY
ncbi:MAG: cupin domain-containing protein [Treponema sp.]|jgi:predicted cupin superfamily sugar epimerase|nr:cupin domain-containing protein [Treponema sp.]